MVEFDFSVKRDVVFPEKIYTERLVLEAVAISNISAQDLFEVYSSQEYLNSVKYIPASPHMSVMDTVSFLSEQEEMFYSNKSVTYFLFENGADVSETSELLGCAGFSIDWDITEASLFIWLLPSARRKGFSAERGEAFLELLFDKLNMRTVRVQTVVENKPSQRAIEKYIVSNGGQLEGIIRNAKFIDSELCDLKQYSITSEEWEE